MSMCISIHVCVLADVYLCIYPYQCQVDFRQKKEEKKKEVFLYNFIATVVFMLEIIFFFFLFIAN